jgi:PII-like signaling protein
VSDGEALQLSVYFGERRRSGRKLLGDALMDAFARRGLQTSMLMRGIEGFGARHRLQSERLLTLSEDLPLVAVAVDSPARIRACAEEVAELAGHGLVTLERARHASPGRLAGTSPAPGEELKLTVLVGRQDRVGGRAAHLAVVELLHRHGVAGATALLGLDGTAGGVRRRARLLSRNARVPTMVVSVGAAERVSAAIGELHEMLPDAMLTLERVRVCRRDGRTVAAPQQPPEPDAEGLAHWQKLTLYTGEQVRHGGEPLYEALVRRLRAEGAAGATVLRGLWGYHGEHPPHGERLWSLRRHVPVVCVVLDTPARMGRWFQIAAELTERTGLVTSEVVPALRASGPGVEHGGLRLATPGAGAGSGRQRSGG